jgi:IS605 OrfB family transposase
MGNSKRQRELVVLAQLKLEVDADIAKELRETLRVKNNMTKYHLKADLLGPYTKNKYSIRSEAVPKLVEKFGSTATQATQAIEKAWAIVGTANANGWHVNPYGSVQMAPQEVTFSKDRKTVDIKTFACKKRGERRKNIPLSGSEQHLQWLRDLETTPRCRLREQEKRRGSRVERMYFLDVPVDCPCDAAYEPTGWLGLDLGVRTVIFDSEGESYGGGYTTWMRSHLQEVRQQCQTKGTKSAKRRLRKIRNREHASIRNQLHEISRAVVGKAKRLQYGLAMETLDGVHEQAKQTKGFNRQVHSWAWGALREKITYKAKRAGVPLVEINPRYTSQTCSACGHTDKKNRNKDLFKCLKCGYQMHADHNAAVNIAARGLEKWEKKALKEAI